jgi:hypothetical protein
VCLKMVDISPLSAYFNREDSDSWWNNQWLEVL